MSGGALNYASYKIDDIVERINPNTVLRRAFVEHLKKISKAVHSIEWNMSGDGDFNEDNLIRDCLSRQVELLQAVADADKALSDLHNAINEAKKFVSKQ